jgi:hypothetical protein
LSTNREELYSYSPEEKKLISLKWNLPYCRIRKDAIEIGGNTFSDILVAGTGVGIKVTEDGGISIGSRLPDNLANLVV